jgi:hypothetical protein
MTLQPAAVPNDSVRSNTRESARRTRISNRRSARRCATNDRGSDTMEQSTHDGNRETNSPENRVDAILNGTALPEVNLELVDEISPKQPNYPYPTIESLTVSSPSSSSEVYHFPNQSSVHTMTDQDMGHHVGLSRSHPDSTTSTSVVPPTTSQPISYVDRGNTRVTRSSTGRSQPEETQRRRGALGRNRLERDTLRTEEQR